MGRYTQLTLEDIIAGCRQESQFRRRGKDGHCFELFSRALDRGDEQAWAAIQQQYGALVHRWVYRAARQTLTEEEMADLCQDSWTKFWRYVSDPAPLSERFPHVGGVLRYLHQCTMSATLDYQRRRQRAFRLQERLQQEALRRPSVVADIAYERTDQQRRIQRVKQWLRSQELSESEVTVMSLAFEHGYTPTEIAAYHPQLFGCSREVRRIRERIIKRARRALAGSGRNPARSGAGEDVGSSDTSNAAVRAEVTRSGN